MCIIRAIGGLVLLAASIASAAQPSPYAGQQQREIKALSSQEVEDYLQGKGMGFAKAAELNHYPGPMHVLQLADKLQLTVEQREKTERIYAAMLTTAKALGGALLEKERQLDAFFASGTIEPAQLQSLVQEIGRLQADIRAVHLQAHVEQKAVLMPRQVAAYDELRGYASGAATRERGLHGSHAH